MNATAHHPCHVLRFKRPARSTAAVVEKSAVLRLEGSLAAVATLAPIIPIFPAFAVAAPHRAASLPRKIRLALP